MFSRVLVANRGEIALRIIRSLQEMGIEAVAVASEPDRDAPHVLAADHGVVLGPAPAAESYLRIEAVLQAARDTGSEAIHPGYGFLSENADFAEACAAAGITFIGPPPAAMRIMGDKVESRRAMEAAGVPVVPGFQTDGASRKQFLAAGASIGVPLLVKASAGGGGKGMRLVENLDQLAAALDLAGSEAQAAFGDGRVYLESYLTRPRHVEVQVFGDAEGRVFAIGERECSIQRRHQKILEECPSPVVDPPLRARMEETAVRAAQAVGYRGAGTVEFLLLEDASFYFLEMNTRLQVEHPVTEMVFGVDLVAAQVRTAAGLPLGFDPEHLVGRGHAIEARIYAEDPEQGFLPASGRVLRLREPRRPGVRVDSGLAEGREVTVHYDPLLAKVVAWGETRATATRRLRQALREMTVLGVTTNIDFLIAVLSRPEWASGDFHTGFLEEHPEIAALDSEPPLSAWAAAAFVAAGSAPEAPAAEGGRGLASPWTDLGSWTPLGGD